ncbi:MAG TPA: N-6 DNA methylase [Thermoanaerobaculales bacterium]|nr:N-6 DNA methylase [Thermoanaerobaculales bacterium]
MLHMLRSVQVANVKGEARRISFRDIDVEQIGYIYEGLLGFTCVTVDQPFLGLIGTAGAEPEIPLATLDSLDAANPDNKALAAAILAWVKDDQPSVKAPSAAALAKALGSTAEPSAISALTQMVGDDSDLVEHVTPWLGAVRTDLRGHPFVVNEGGLMVKETPSRRNAGAYYTPKSLAEEVVLHALQPLCYSPGPHQSADESTWVLRSSDDLLGLKVADIACGSGAFLVAAARYLSERVVEAWTTEDPANAQRSNLYLRAVRQVVANCLYGADINDMAVEMCKLSLWLVSLDRDLPFSFVDDKVFLGNSLLGLTNLEQLRKLHIEPKRVPMDRKFDIFDVDIDAIIRKAVDLRERLATEIDEDDPARNSTAKRRQLAELHRVTADLRQIADGVIAAGLELGGKPGKALDEAYGGLQLAVKQAHPGPDEAAATAWLDGVIERGLTPTVPTDYERWRPLHWVIEAPDVIVDHGGFDAVIGNPPFLGGQKLTGAMGTTVRDWFVNTIAGGRRGSADLVAYFFLRATSLLQANGDLGLIATNTVAQGDSREVGLDAMVADGFTITRAIQSRSWPAATANLEYAAVWGTRSEVASDVPRIADDSPVRRISTLLEPAGRAEGNPVRLAENAGIAFQGCIVLGMGFVVDQDEAQEWIATDPRNAEVLFPYLNGEDLNSRPDASASRWVIDFNNRSEMQSAAYTLPFDRVKRLVKPERDRLDGRNSTATDRAKHWWKYGRRAPAMRKAIASLPEVLVIARVSKTVMPVRVASSQVFSHALGVFATGSSSDQAVLSSSLHQMWAITYGSTLETCVRYTPSDVFETFPLPTPTERLDSAGLALEELRGEVMLRRDLGLTKLYNLINDSSVQGDPDVDRLREVHVEIDTAATAAYGWDDVGLDHGFNSFRQAERWTVGYAARTEILDRLLLENHRRAQDGRGGMGQDGRRTPNSEGTLFGWSARQRDCRSAAPATSGPTRCATCP